MLTEASSRYGYDGMGRLTRVHYPDGTFVTYSYRHGEPFGVTINRTGVETTVITDATHEPFGPAAGWRYGNGLTRRINRDIDRRVTGLSTGTDGEVKQSLTYAYEKRDLVTQITHGLDAGQTNEFGYDGVGRLTRQDNTTHGRQSWVHDWNGNRAVHNWPGTETYSVNGTSNRHNSTTLLQFKYDTLGNLTRVGFEGSEFLYGYDGFNRKTTVTRNNSMPQATTAYVTAHYPNGTSTYISNGLNERTFKRTPNGAWRYVYAPDQSLLAEQNVSTGKWTHYVRFNGEVVAIVRDGALYYVHNDHLGRPELVTNEQQAPVWRATNYALDRAVTLDNFGGLNLGFPGQYYDAESGLWYNLNRYYDPRRGAYTQADPIGLAGGSFSTYLYADNNPVTKIDPQGLTSAFISAGGNFFFGGGAAESSIGVDTTGNVCYVSSTCSVDLSIGAGAGLSIGAGGGKGAYCDSYVTQEQTRAELSLAGVGAGATVSDDLSSGAAGRGIIGWSAGASFETCRVITRCVNLFGN